MSDSLGCKHLSFSRNSCPSLSPGVYSGSCPLSPWSYLTISSPATLFSSCLQSFPVSGSFPTSLLFMSSDQSIGASASAWVLPMNIHGWFSLGLTDLISLLPKGLLRVYTRTTIQKYQFFSTQPSLQFNSHMHTLILEKPKFWSYGTLSPKWCHCFLMHCLRLSKLFFQGASVF